MHQEQQSIAFFLDQVGADALLIIDKQLQALFGLFGHHDAVDSLRVELYVS